MSAPSFMSNTSDDAGTLQTLRNRLSRALNTSPPKEPKRSQSRGRNPTLLTSTGRGGAGNFKRPESVSRDQPDGDERGRELSPAHPERVTHSGRGGAGNVRSPSRDPAVVNEERRYEREIVEARKKLESTQIHSIGRGGAGNQVSPARGENSTSRSRSRARAPSADAHAVHSTGRGGFGNVTHNGITESELERLDEEDRKVAEAHNTIAHATGVHSTGRGGAANITHGIEPVTPHGTADAGVHHPNAVYSTGRGGRGNMSGTPTPDEARGRSDEKHPHGGIIGEIWNKVTGHHEHSPSAPNHK